MTNLPPAGADQAEVLLVCGSPSDLDLVLTCQETLTELAIASAIRGLSAHRTPDEAAACARDAEKQGVRVLISFAGLSAQLGGVCAAHSRLPVIAVPVVSGPLVGMDAAICSLQMPPGTPLAVVSLDGAKNAALLAARILALGRPDLRDRLSRYDEKARERYAPEKIEAEIAKRRKAKSGS